MIGLALSGGGSRAMAFHLGCLRALNDIGILRKISVISTISGGSVVGAYYAFTPGKSFEEFESDLKRVLREGFQRKIALQLMNPTNLLPCLGSFLIAQWQDMAARLVGTKSVLSRTASITEIFCRILRHELFPGVSLSSPTRHGVEIVIGACELRTGSAFRFDAHKSGCWRHGQLVEEYADVALAVAASAAYPVILPAIDRTWEFRKNGKRSKVRVLLTDGGVYDNLGLQVLEPGRDPAFSLHTYPCDYLISCNAGPGQESGAGTPLAIVSRITRSFQTIHRRAQELTMHRLFDLKEAGRIKGFAMPYLGQIDSQLPWKPGTLVPRDDVIDYPTDFASMSEKWIERLSSRGEQLTRALVSFYLSDLL